MYCEKCGAQNNDGARFCLKCGSPLGQSDATEKRDPSDKKTINVYTVLTALVLVVAILVISMFDLWPWGTKSDSTANIAATGENEEITDKQSEEEEGFSFDKVIEECPDCQGAIEAYIQLLSEINDDNNTNYDRFNILVNQLSEQINHFCAATTVYVESMPYALYGTYGTYTGEWVGAGPSGKGSYVGGRPGKMKVFNTVVYEGDWEHGLPNGEGELFREDYVGPWDMTYIGEFKDGKRHGTGYLYEEYDNMYEIDYKPHFRIYECSEFENDKFIRDEVKAVTYDMNNGDIIEYSMMIMDDDGLPNNIPTKTWKPGELTPAQKEVLGTAGALFVVGSVVYMMGTLLKEAVNPDLESVYRSGLVQRPLTPEENLQMLENYREEKEKAAADMAEREAERLQRAQNAAYNEADRLYQLGETNTWQYKEAASFGGYPW